MSDIIIVTMLVEAVLGLLAWSKRKTVYKPARRVVRAR